jgi:hypothetical protein
MKTELDRQVFVKISSSPIRCNESLFILSGVVSCGQTDIQSDFSRSPAGLRTRLKIAVMKRGGTDRKTYDIKN